MFQLWLNKVYRIVKRSLSESEISKAESLYQAHYTPSGAAEYLGK